MKTQFTLLLLLFCAISFAQTPIVNYSAPFDEPDGLNAKTFQCKNGNTLLLNFTVHKGIEVDVYDASGRKLRHAVVSSNLWEPDDMKSSTVEGIYNIGENVTLFLSQTIKNKPSLFRILISPTTGLVVSQAKIAELPPYKLFGRYQESTGFKSPRAFYIEKDPESDAYAILISDSFEEGKGKNLKLIHYDGSHKEISTGYYDDPDQQGKSAEYLGMVVLGSDEVILSTYSFDPKLPDTSRAAFTFSHFQANTFSYHSFRLTEPIPQSRAILQYNKHKGVIDMLVVSKIGNSMTNKIIYTCLMVAFNPKDNNLVYLKGLDTKLATEYGKAHYKEQRKEDLMPMNMVINKEGNVTVVSEQISFDNYFTTLGEFGAVEYDEKGDAIQGYLIQKSHVSKTYIPMLSHDDARKNKVNIYKGVDFISNDNPYYYSCRYFNTTQGQFVIFNDHPGNFDRPEGQYPSALGGVKASNTICHKLASGAISKFYLFGRPNDQFENRYAALTSGSYSETTGTYSVIIIETSGRKRQARIAWVHMM